MRESNNYIFPFLWVHGEPAKIYRQMVQAIYDANIGAFCVEARPHKEFAREKWWQDMEVILTEAERLGMKVWILDDKHFPTGYANGGVSKAPLAQHRQHLCRQQVAVSGGKTIKLNTNKYIHPKNHYNMISKIMLLVANGMRIPKKYKDDKLLSCTAYSTKEYIDLSPFITEGKLSWQAPTGEWSIEIISLSRDTGMHRNYINMLDEESCAILIDEVYEPHYAHFKERFGTTIAGFFSDEPELGNGNYTKHYNYLGTDQSLPYSEKLANELEKTLGADWKCRLALLWKNDYDTKETAKLRYKYMDLVSRLVENCFSKQIGQWCNEHSVEYIGHVIEDNNQHARTSTSLGHYYRGLKYQNMAGIDNIGGQVQPGGEDLKKRFVFGYENDGEFYHYALGKLGSSLGAINPRMKGRTMCEIFGNYGWSLGVRDQKYMVDHFMVRGVNRFVPHAFNSKEYPDKDCPPHFYAHGHNPLYRHFGELMKYTNRVCGLLSGGKIVTPAAILYHGEAEWSGECMLMQKPARILQDNQIDFNFLPADVFAEREFYKTEIGPELVVNERCHKVLIVPYAQFITWETAMAIVELQKSKFPVIFLEALPEGICTGETLPCEITKCTVVTLENLLEYLETLQIRDISIEPADNRIRAMHYLGEPELLYLVNEGAHVYEGNVKLPFVGDVCGYDAWNDKEYSIAVHNGSVKIVLEPKKSIMIFHGKSIEESAKKQGEADKKTIALTNFSQSICRSIDYPNFSKGKQITELESYHLTDKNFSGYIRYETFFELNNFTQVILNISDAYEGVEVFVNGKSTEIQVVPEFRFNIGKLCTIGENHLVIEVATTLERERGIIKKAKPTGIVGEVKLKVE